MNIDDIKTKSPDELNEDERDFLKESWDSLSEEEQTTFKDVNSSEPESVTFKTQEEFDKAVSERAQKVAEQVLEEKEKARLEAEEAKKRPPEENFFPEDYQAKNWDEAARQMYPKFRDRMLKEQAAAAKLKQEQINKINKRFDDELEAIAAKDKTIPKKGTPERKEFEKELSQIGLEYTGVTNMTQAYKIMKALGRDKKGKVSARQSDLAGKIGRSGGEGTPVKERSHRELSERSMDELIEEEQIRLGIKN